MKGVESAGTTLRSLHNHTMALKLEMFYELSLLWFNESSSGDLKDDFLKLQLVQKE